MKRPSDRRPTASHLVFTLFLVHGLAVAPIHAQHHDPTNRKTRAQLVEEQQRPLRVRMAEQAAEQEWAEIREARVAAMPTSAGYVRESDSLALVVFYHATNGDEWENNSGWLSAPVDQWHGITVSGDRVVEIDLCSNGLTGQLPSEVGDLSKLTYLDLSRNAIAGEIPSEWAVLEQLTVFKLGWNNLTGQPMSVAVSLRNLTWLTIGPNHFEYELPDEIGTLRNLRRLSLRASGLSGTLPATLANLVYLEELNLYDNALTGPIPRELGALTRLTAFYADDNQFEGTIPREFGALVNLRDLVLSGNNLTGPIPEELRHLTQLQYLYLSYNDLSGDLPSWLGELRGLKVLALRSNSLTGSLPDIGSLHELETLALSRSGVSGPIPRSIGGLSNLQYLMLDHTNMTGPVPEEIGHLSKLRILHLRNLGLSGALTDKLAQLKNLEVLDLSHNDIRLLPDLSQLTKLAGVEIDHNRLGFESIEPLHDGVSGYYSYSPQERIGYPDTLKVNEDEEVELQVETGGEHSTYRWYRNYLPVDGATQNPLVIPSVTVEDAGEYVLYVSNTVVQGLTLVSEPITVVLNAPPEWTAYAAPPEILRFDSLRVTWQGHDPDGTLRHLEWELAGTRDESGTDTTGVLRLTDLPSGAYTLRARLVDDTRGVSPWEEHPFTVVENAVPAVGADVIETDEDRPADIDVLANDTDANDDTLRIVAFSQPAHGTVTHDTTAAPHLLRYVPENDFFGTDTFTYRVEDGYGGSAEATVDLTITAVNDVPRLTVPLTFAATQNEYFTAEVAATDVEGDDVTIGIASLPVWLTYTDGGAGTSGMLAGTPGPADTGAQRAVFELGDGTDTGRDTLTIEVANVNDPPEALADAFDVPEDSIFVLDVLGNDTDADGDTLVLQATLAPQHGTADINAQVPSMITYTPTANYFGPDTLAYRIEDPAGMQSEALVVLTVTPVNDRPVVTSEPVTQARQDAAYTYTVTAEDVEGDSLRFGAEQLPAWLRLSPTDSAAATLSGTPGPSDVGKPTITITVSDGAATTRQAFAIEVGNVNDAPSAVAVVEPEDGASVLLEGEPDQPFVVTWDAAEDPDAGDEVEYTWELSRTDGFETALLQATTDTERRYATTYLTLAKVLKDAGIGVDEAVAFFHRVVSTDGHLQTAGPASQLTLTRGRMVGVDAPQLPDAFALHGNYPNPVNPATRISLDLPEAAEVVVTVYDLLGREMSRIRAESVPAGRARTVVVDGTGWPSGLFLYRVECRAASGAWWTASGSMTLLR